MNMTRIISFDIVISHKYFSWRHQTYWLPRVPKCFWSGGATAGRRIPLLGIPPNNPRLLIAYSSVIKHVMKLDECAVSEHWDIHTHKWTNGRYWTLSGGHRTEGASDDELSEASIVCTQYYHFRSADNCVQHCQKDQAQATGFFFFLRPMCRVVLLCSHFNLSPFKAISLCICISTVYHPTTEIDQSTEALDWKDGSLHASRTTPMTHQAQTLVPVIILNMYSNTAGTAYKVTHSGRIVNF